MAGTLPRKSFTCKNIDADIAKRMQQLVELKDQRKRVLDLVVEGGQQNLKKAKADHEQTLNEDESEAATSKSEDRTMNVPSP